MYVYIYYYWVDGQWSITWLSIKKTKPEYCTSDCYVVNMDLFLLGTEVGGNKMILEGLHTIGFEALVITLAAVAGSVLGAWGLWLFISYRDVKGGKE